MRTLSSLAASHMIASRCAGCWGVSHIRAHGLPRTLLIMSRAAAEGIEVEGLVREFKNGPRAVDGIELAVSPGEIYGFLGPNGAGKSTTVLMLTTLLPPTAGTARVAGHDIIRDGAAVRASIGAALQEAALDPLLTGRDHMRLQTTLQGVPKAKRRERGDELIDRVGLTDAADRKVGGYSGGMKRRLDVALALVHSPRVLFLDEPTTGLDPSSRADLWAEVARLARDDGVTVFLTTQYLEEADVLADRVGIIDHGKIVAEGTPEALKAEIGRPSVEAVPADPSDRDALAAVLSRFGARRAVAARPRGRAARQRRGSRRGGSRARCRRCARGRPPAAPAVARRRLPGQDRPQARSRRDAGGGRGLTLWQQTYEMARRSVLQTLRQPAMVIPPVLFPLILMGINVSRARRRHEDPGLPDRQLSGFRDRVPVRPGLAVRVDQRGQRDRARCRDRLPEPARADADAARRDAARAARGRAGGRPDLGPDLPGGGFAAGLHVKAGFWGVLVLLVLAMLIALAFASLGAFIGLRTGSGEAVQGVFPLFFVFLFLSSSSLPRNLIEHEWFRTIATYNPVSYLFEGLRSLIIFGWQGKALGLGFLFAGSIALIGVTGSSTALRNRLART